MKEKRGFKQMVRQLDPRNNIPGRKYFFHFYEDMQLVKLG